jgi:hypothetical protein
MGLLIFIIDEDGVILNISSNKYVLPLTFGAKPV